MLKSLFQELLRFTPGPAPLRRMGQYLIGIGLPLWFGLLVGEPVLGMFGALGGLYAQFLDLGGPLRQRVSIVIGGTLALCAAFGLGTLLAGHGVFTLLALLPCYFFAGWLHGSGLWLENIARFSAIVLTLSATASPMFGAVALYALGGLALGLAIALLDGLLLGQPLSRNDRNIRETLRAVWAGQHAGLRFSFCYGVMALAALLMGLTLDALHPAWASIAVIVVMRPDGAVSLHRSFQRLIGTLLGVAITAALLLLAHNQLMLMTSVLLLAWLIPLGTTRHYWIGACLITVLVLLLLDIAWFQHGGDRQFLTDRLIDTVLGCLLGAIGTLASFPDAWHSLRMTPTAPAISTASPGDAPAPAAPDATGLAPEPPHKPQ